MATVPGFSILATAVNKDDEIISYEETKKMLEEHPDIDSLFIVAGGVYGAAERRQSEKRKDADYRCLRQHADDGRHDEAGRLKDHHLSAPVPTRLSSHGLGLPVPGQ